MKKIIKISGMHCASCAASIEKSLNEIKGVKASVNFGTESAEVEGKFSESKIIEVIKSIGYGIIKDGEKDAREKEVKEGKFKFIVAIILSIPLLYFAMGPHVGLGIPEIFEKNLALVQFLLTTPIILVGYQFYTRGFSAV